MTSNGSIDSMEKSYNSSIEDNQSYDIYEAHNPNPSAFAYNPTIEYHKSPSRFEMQYSKPAPTFDIGYRNEGFRDNSTFGTNSNYQSRAESIQDNTNDETPIMTSETGGISYPPSEYFTTDTLPISSKTDTTSGTARTDYDPIYSRDRPNPNLLNELQRRMPKRNSPPTVHSPTYSDQLQNLQYTPEPAEDRPQSANILETDFHQEKPKPKVRSKSEVLLETNFDFTPPSSPQFNQPISDVSRSKSQPLETAM